MIRETLLQRPDTWPCSFYQVAACGNLRVIGGTARFFLKQVEDVSYRFDGPVAHLRLDDVLDFLLGIAIINVHEESYYFFRVGSEGFVQFNPF